ncbi:MAG: 1-acyl-sn-glycerol-3-phosphate acyltransferase [Taibaiella sp.]|nr:1-acyl-sn-glycerol-3-phosphate acyltransferase [Taibaiella sp.]
MYLFVKIWLRFALRFYCGNVTINRGNIPARQTPVILASNHPNSFLDALLIAAHYPTDVHFMARGDAFKKPFVARILRMLKLIPIYRLSEGKENLSVNEKSFTECVEVLKKNGTVLIFPEGLCEHQLGLRPLRKGTARVAYKAWYESGINDMLVQPIAIRYNSFSYVPKEVDIKYGNSFLKDTISAEQPGLFYNDFNALLSERMEIAMLDNAANSKKKKIKNVFLSLAAFIGFATQRWYYIAWRNFAAKKTEGTVFYDSVLFGCLMLTYPLFVIFMTMLLWVVTGCYWMLSLIVLLPFTAWCYKEYKS